MRCADANARRRAMNLWPTCRGRTAEQAEPRTIHCGRGRLANTHTRARALSLPQLLPLSHSLSLSLSLSLSRVHSLTLSLTLSLSVPLANDSFALVELVDYPRFN